MQSLMEIGPHKESYMGSSIFQIGINQLPKIIVSAIDHSPRLPQSISQHHKPSFHTLDILGHRQEMNHCHKCWMVHCLYPISAHPPFYPHPCSMSQLLRQNHILWARTACHNKMRNKFPLE